MSTVVQPCARCGARWAVQGSPMHWCPRCRGVLLSPGPIDAAPEHRNYRWVARRPDHRPRRADTASRPPSGAPSYSQIPRWGLVDHTPGAAEEPRRGIIAGFGARVNSLLVITAAMFALAALGELIRYGILLRNRTRLIDPWVLRLSDALVTASAALSLILGLAAAVALVAWLVDARAAAYARAGHRDPRSARTLALGCLIPVVNLLWPGVFLTELARLTDDPRGLRAVRVWWAAWLLGGALAVVALLWRTADSLQAKADGVLFTALTDVGAAALAVLSLWLPRYLDGRTMRGEERAARRWVFAADPLVQVIEPVHPTPEDVADAPALRDAPARDIPEDRVTDIAVDRQHEEVMAK
ncbi:DUF4328 domain-containing protein [Nocardia bovistercoris]|uniref:DUF4328 domain-containing protein n=1 Tax=Nocardia bovistercoris TaxID=2785916 RepID=A0A931IEA0_9NOCA|nr:DUF4328 domain-containing protein [Nocardia bovistercoris]MBH0778948.1 DUF4328 domain-containing protein [Nocardia bovistercoris]